MIWKEFLWASHEDVREEMCSGFEGTILIKLGKHKLPITHGVVERVTSVYWPNTLRSGVKVPYGTFSTPQDSRGLVLCDLTGV